MAHILKLECIGDDYLSSSQMALLYDIFKEKKPPKDYWVAEIVGTSNKWHYERKFVEYKKDYLHSNSVGSRGIYAVFVLEEGRVYEVSSPRSWKRTDRYFCKIINSELIKIDKKEVDEWLKTRLA